MYSSECTWWFSCCCKINGMPCVDCDHQQTVFHSVASLWRDAILSTCSFFLGPSPSMRRPLRDHKHFVVIFPSLSQPIARLPFFRPWLSARAEWLSTSLWACLQQNNGRRPPKYILMTHLPSIGLKRETWHDRRAFHGRSWRRPISSA